jgi:hypothetical protein
MKFIYLVFFLYAIILFYLVFLVYKKESFVEQPIDMVYLWVADEDPERVEYLSKLPEWDGNLDKTRYSEHQELKYSLRSVEMYCPWIQTIYIVTKDGQVPSYINFTNPKIKLVHHSQIMPESSRPTFNSMAIETCVHNIPGLSDFYIYMNDDIFFKRPMTPSDFIHKTVPKVNVREKPKKREDYSFDETFSRSMDLANKLTNQSYYIELPHTPTMCYKPWDMEIEAILKAIPHKDTNRWDWTTHSKFRENHNIALNNCFRTIYYLYKGGEKVSYQSDMFNLKDTCTFSSNPTSVFLCINHISDACDEMFKRQIDMMYPTPSSYEK